ncbi:MULTISPECIES: peroxiredoxin [Pseudoalteromonas]|jgi:peroxiredoxin|uniref:Glutathione-dependent peroxiredoxin n=2 Tax=Pseudoalteromonas TaxID=53246 RepID=A0A4P9J3W6_9GAMM|nr:MULTISPECIES: peroxiredoxin [Pseudoalteromonas]KAA1157739.1 peroxiredoxin [Pseudoalteromonas distincta]KHM47170.1 peroxiredoxin [Pseudoalteromonas elyakovii]KID38311.1 peroxiredoxin [Pseudoalteromonas distincta]MBB1275660.1 peroxiredoxin [Pseudoalteromonas sp. SR43-3]MBB1279782.1 peroxiredoxin [Pseudoalteromonas sp. SR41-1]|tara:strand:+ start:5948 stop:6421 length:474 start_codon:yes stop_codon:yes gene_type:complete
MIEQGQELPAVTLTQLTDDGMQSLTNKELFEGKKVVLFAVPGAFTPTCSNAHLPEFITLADKIKAKGVDAIYCVSVNDAFVMKAWGDSQNAQEITMLGDGDGSFTKSLGLDKDTASFGGIRSTRYAMIIENALVTGLFVEQDKEFVVSRAESVLEKL